MWGNIRLDWQRHQLPQLHGQCNKKDLNKVSNKNKNKKEKSTTRADAKTHVTTNRNDRKSFTEKAEELTETSGKIIRLLK